MSEALTAIWSVCARHGLGGFYSGLGKLKPSCECSRYAYGESRRPKPSPGELDGLVEVDRQHK